MLRPYIHKLVAGINLTCDEMQEAMGLLMDGNVSQAQMAAFLVALAVKGEKAAEIQGATQAVMARMQPLAVGPEGAIDTCGTGGDGAHTFNISTAAGILAAAAGVKVVKHGNRAVSSACGSADVLEALGIDIGMSPERAQDCLAQHNFCFCFAPNYHPAMRNVAGVRRELGVRTIFNIIGPLVNPSPLKGQVMGVYDPGLMDKLADVMAGLGRHRALLVHGHGGIDEVSLAGKNTVVCIQEGKKCPMEIGPEDFDLPSRDQQDLAGGDAQVNAQIIRKIFAGELGARRDTVVANAATALYVEGIADSFAVGARQAAAALDSGAAQRLLTGLTEFSRK